MTVAEALRGHYAAAGLPLDGGRGAERWLLQLGPVRARLANFAWRRRALQCHDIHHLVTGYACTPSGELEIAAWEFAAGPFPNPWSSLFCLPLVGLGALTIPRRSLAAFVRGRSSRTLYRMPCQDELIALPLDILRARLLPEIQPPVTARALAGYAALALVSLALMAAPLSALLLLFLTHV
jgi:hypothetical protein